MYFTKLDSSFRLLLSSPLTILFPLFRTVFNFLEFSNLLFNAVQHLVKDTFLTQPHYHSIPVLQRKILCNEVLVNLEKLRVSMIKVLSNRSYLSGG